MKTELQKFDETLTPEEKETQSYLDWSDETLGRCVKAFSKDLLKMDVKGFESVKTTAAVYALISVARGVNAGEFTQTMSGTTHNGKPTGDWKITVKQIKRK